MPAIGAFRLSRTFTRASAVLAIAVVGSLHLPVASAIPLIPYRGKWSPTYSSPTYIAVHLALLRDTSSSTYHSKIVWWNDEDSGEVHGGIYGWNPATTASEDTCSTFPPDAHFHPIDMYAPNFNMFCGGQVQLAPGSMVVAGGTEYGEVGITDSKLFYPGGSGSAMWSADSQMAIPRWYPSMTALPDGRAMVNGGTEFVHMLIYGGLNSSTTHPSSSLRRLGLRRTAGGRWDSPVDTTSRTDYPFTWPDSLEGHTLTDAADGHPAVLFGGRIANGTARSGMWFRDQEERPFGADVGYYWQPMTVPGSDQTDLKRGDHTAVNVINNASAPYDTANGFLIYGGRDGSTVNATAWRFHTDTQNSPHWKWEKIQTYAGEGPNGGSGVYGHVAVYDTTRHRMLVFGGTSGTGADPSDNAIYALDLKHPGGYCHWSTPHIYAPNGQPPALMGSLCAVDSRVLTRVAAPSTSQLRTGQAVYLFGGKTKQSDSYVTASLWQLWMSADSTCDSLEWEPIAPDSTPPAARAWGTAIYDVASARVVFMGGHSALGTVGKDVFGLDVGQNSGDAIPSGFHYHWQAMQSLPETGEISHCAAISGSNFVTARTAEITPSNGSAPSWSHATGDSSFHAEPWYPFMFVMPDGRLFNAGTGNDAGHQSAVYNLSTNRWGPFPVNPTHQSTFYPGSAVMFRPGMVMACGARDEYYSDDVSTGSLSKAEFIDFTHVPHDSDATWASTINNMQSPRLFHNLVIVPDGDVFAVGGLTQDAHMDSATAVADAVMHPEIFYPDTVNSTNRGLWRWTTTHGDMLAASHLERDYHGTALLLPDGRILAGGGNAAPTYAKQLEIYCPPYLFDSNGAKAARPAFHSTLTPPTNIRYGQTFYVAMDALTHLAAVDSIVLIKPGAVTHGFDEDQRFLRLPISYCETDSSVLAVTAPANANLAPPGDYLMFLVYKNRPDLGFFGTPSIASWVRVGSDTTGFTIDCWSGGGGCPIAELRTAGGWTMENTILGRSHTGAMSTDGLVLQGVPTPASGPVTVRIREDERELTTLDKIRLAVVDHPTGTEVFTAGEQILLGTREPAYRVTTSSGMDITALVSSAHSKGWIGNPGDIVTVEMDAPVRAHRSGAEGGGGVGAITAFLKEGPGGGGGAALRKTGTASPDRDQAWLDQTGILIQLPDGVGGWRTVAHQYPRERANAAVMDSLGHGTYRIVFVGRHQLSFLGRIAMSPTTSAPTILAPLMAAHSRLGNVLPATGGNGPTTNLVPGDTLTMNFAAPSPAEGMTRDFVLLTHGVYTSNLPGDRGLPGEHGLPQQFALGQNVPNPFRSTTAIQFALPVASRVKLEIFDLLGRRIRTMTDEQWGAGYHQVEWDRRDTQGNLIRNGVFLYRMTAGTFTDHKKMVIVQ